jgi:hypothetical protein
MPRSSKQSIKDQLISIAEELKLKKRSANTPDDKLQRFARIVTPIATVIGIGSIFLTRKFNKDSK